MRFAKGHGTGNDFVILPDADGQLDLSPELVARICDRHTGLGADGVLRAVRTAVAGLSGSAPGLSARPGGASARDGLSGATWFMDYRNADGSLSEMCGNGIRVFARYLLEQGLAAGPVIPIATRAGVRQVSAAADGELTVDMGPALVLGESSALVGGRGCAGLAITVGNPHLACLVDEPVAAFDLSSAPLVDDRMFPAGANVELVRITGPHQAEMRVHERGSGVTRSCGTGAVAGAVAAAAATVEWAAGERAAGERAPGERAPVPAASWTVDVPGGRLTVTPDASASLLAGPAVIVAAGELDDAWLAAQRAAPSVA